MKKYLTNKDIMQDDWLYPRNSNIPDKVFSIGKHVYMGGTTDCITFEKDINVHYYTFMCNPVPLTPEILEKNGFKFMTNLWYLKIKEGKPIQIAFKNNNVITLSINATPIPIDLKFVHQLQHALRLYGIEKEIEL